MEDLRGIIAKNIAELRRCRDMTQFDLAQKLNYSDKAVSKWERGESVPDIAVLKQIADLFGVTVDDLLRDKPPVPVEQRPQKTRRWIRGRGFLTGLCIVLVWLVATFCFVVLRSLPNPVSRSWLTFVYAVPVSFVVWLVLNSVWFSRRRNYLIISLLMWTALAALFLSFLVFGRNLWLLFVLGVPGQVIIVLWARMAANLTRKRECE